MSSHSLGLKAVVANDSVSADSQASSPHLLATSGSGPAPVAPAPGASVMPAMHHLHWSLSKAEASLPRTGSVCSLDRHRERELIRALLTTAVTLDAQCLRLIRHGARCLIRVRVDERESDLAACSARLMKALHDALMRMAGVECSANPSERVLLSQTAELPWPEDEQSTDEDGVSDLSVRITQASDTSDTSTDHFSAASTHGWAGSASAPVPPCRLRLSVMPLAAGGLCLRIDLQGGQTALKHLDQVGFEDDDLIKIEKALARTGSAILVGGPARSGRSHTLYAMMARLDAKGRSIQTVEQNPLRLMPGWLQSEFVAASQGVLAARLASNLADAALLDIPFTEPCVAPYIQLCQSGALVMAPVPLARAHHVFALAPRIPPSVLARHLSLVIAQRLVRRLCSQCSRPDHSPDMRAVLARAANAGLINHAMTPASASPRGCPACRGTGYTGRTLIYELLEVDEAVQAMLDDGSPASQLEQRLLADGRCLWDQAVRLLARGVTSLEAVREAVREP